MDHKALFPNLEMGFLFWISCRNLQIALIAGNVKMCLCQNYTGKKLKEIGLHFSIGESGVSQVCRRAAQKIEKDKKLNEQIDRL